MIKVALVVHAFPSPEHPYIVDWVKVMQRSGMDLTLYSETQNRMPVEADILPHVKYFNLLEAPLFSLRRNLWESLASLRHVPWALKLLQLVHPGKPLSVLRKLYEYLPLLGKRFDLVHFNAPQLATRRFELGGLLSAKTLVSFRGQDFSFDALRFRPLLEQADHLHFISEHLIELARAEGYAADRHTLIPPLVDLDLYKPSVQVCINKTRADTWVLFSAARFTWTKGWEYALQAVALLLQRGWDIQYYIAGQGGFREAILYTIAELGIQERVHCLGWLSPKELVAQMHKSDLYLLASVEEGFNNSVLQAQACGLPVVCSDAGGLPENIEDRVTGLLFRRRDAWDMAEKIEVLLGDAGLRASMQQAGRQRAEARFSMQAGVDAFVELYRSLAGKK